MKNFSNVNMPTMPAINSTPQNNNQIFNSNTNSYNEIPITNQMQIPYNNNNNMQQISNNYPASDYYGNSDPSLINNNNDLNYGNDFSNNINMDINSMPPMDRSMNMNAGAYNKDNYTPQTRDRLRMAGNNIFK